MHALSPRELRQVRGREIAMILQNPMTSLDPLFTIGNQLGEVLATRCDVPAAQLRERADRAAALGAHDGAGGAAAAVSA